MELHAKYTFFAEGARGHLTKRLKRFDLEATASRRSMASASRNCGTSTRKACAGPVIHTQGWPLERRLGRRLPLSSGEQPGRAGLRGRARYATRYLSPFEEFQRWKTASRRSAPMLEGGRRVSYGARAINEGGWQAVPKLAFPGGALIGCSAGFVNVPRIKGSHTAMKSGMLAAEAAFEAIGAAAASDELTAYDDAYKLELGRETS
jgi:electron-transferring-flavoprotein dehydrogenase